MKILALDIGDVWIGTAISDALGMFARPLQTVKIDELTTFLTETLAKEKIATVVVGYPKTMSGTESDQTKKIVATKDRLEKKFPNFSWILWDERLSSKRAGSTKKTRTKEEKQHAHSVAAAFILSSYLENKRFEQDF